MRQLHVAATVLCCLRWAPIPHRERGFLLARTHTPTTQPAKQAQVFKLVLGKPPEERPTGKVLKVSVSMHAWCAGHALMGMGAEPGAATAIPYSMPSLWH